MGLVDTLCNTTLFDFSSADENKRERPTKLTFPSSKTQSFIFEDLSFLFVEHFSQILLSYFKQIHGEQYFTEIIFQILSIKNSKPTTTLDDILQKDIIQFEQEFHFNSIQRNLDFVRRAIQLPIIEPLNELRLNQYFTLVLHSILIGLKYVELTSENDEPIANDQILHDIARIAIKFGDIIRHSTRNTFLNYHLFLSILLTKGIRQLSAIDKP